MKPNTLKEQPIEDWEKLRPEIIQGRLTFFNDTAKGGYPDIYYLEDILAQNRAESRTQTIKEIEKELRKWENRFNGSETDFENYIISIQKAPKDKC